MMDMETLQAVLRDVTNHLEHMIRHRHNQAHNGDIVTFGPFERCQMCQPVRKAIIDARAALASTPAAPPRVEMDRETLQALTDETIATVAAIKIGTTMLPYHTDSPALDRIAALLSRWVKAGRALATPAAPPRVEMDRETLQALFVYLDAQFGLALRPEHARVIRRILASTASTPGVETEETRVLSCGCRARMALVVMAHCPSHAAPAPEE